MIKNSRWRPKFGYFLLKISPLFNQYSRKIYKKSANRFSLIQFTTDDPLSFFHLNCRGLSANWESFQNLLCDIHGTSFSFDVIGISEIYKCRDDSRTSLSGYHNLISRCRDEGSRGGVGLFIKSSINYNIREDISVFIPNICETLFIEIVNNNGRNVVVGVVYRPNTEPHADIDIFSSNMEHIMDTIQHENKHCLIMGDMNIDLLKFETHTKTDDYLDNLFTHGFIPLITKPTRVTTHSATLIDHMYTNDITSTYNSGIVINDVADHFGTFCLFHGKMKKSIPAKQKKRSFNSNNIETFQTKLRETDFSEIVNIECPNIAYNTFLRLYLIAFNDSFPLRDVNVRSKYIRREPWFTPDLLASSLTKAKLLSQKLRKPTTENVKHYKDHLIEFNRLKRNTKKSYFKTALEENKRNSKKCWSILKQAIGKINDKSSYPQTFMINNSKISDKGEISEGFNNFFSSIGLQTSHNVPSSKKCFSSYMPKPSNRSFFSWPSGAI